VVTMRMKRIATAGNRDSMRSLVGAVVGCLLACTLYVQGDDALGATPWERVDDEASYIIVFQEDYATAVQTRVQQMCASSPADVEPAEEPVCTTDCLNSDEDAEPTEPLAVEWYVCLWSGCMYTDADSIAALTPCPGGGSSILCIEDAATSHRRAVAVHSSLLTAYVVRGVRHSTLRAFLDHCELAPQVGRVEGERGGRANTCAPPYSSTSPAQRRRHRWRFWRGTS
jgi:hypothetical protein